jgi:hypothetical protein
LTISRQRLPSAADEPLATRSACVDTDRMMKLIIAMTLALAALNSCMHVSMPKVDAAQIEVR